MSASTSRGRLSRGKDCEDWRFGGPADAAVPERSRPAAAADRVVGAMRNRSIAIVRCEREKKRQANARKNALIELLASSITSVLLLNPMRKGMSWTFVSGIASVMRVPANVAGPRSSPRSPLGPAQPPPHAFAAMQGIYSSHSQTLLGQERFQQGELSRSVLPVHLDQRLRGQTRDLDLRPRLRVLQRNLCAEWFRTRGGVMN